MTTDAMEPAEFARRFIGALDAVADQAAQRVGGPVARSYSIAFGEPGRRPLITAERAAELLYDGGGLFPPIIDIAVIELRDDHTVLFVRPSDHARAPWNATWN